MDRAKATLAQAQSGFLEYRDKTRQVANTKHSYELADYISYGFMACGALAIVLVVIGIQHGFGAA
jgi:hypothetical protein